MHVLDTSVQEIEEVYKKFVKRDDIDIILINQNVSEDCIILKSWNLFLAIIVILDIFITP